MKNLKHLFKICLLLFVITCAVNCGKDGGLLDIFIPDLSQNWKNITSADNDQYFFNADTTNVPTGNFTGNEQNETTQENNTFAGSFNHSQIQFTFNLGPKTGTTYSGTINGNANPVTMTLTTPTGTITLERQP